MGWITDAGARALHHAENHSLSLDPESMRVHAEVARLSFAAATRAGRKPRDEVTVPVGWSCRDC